MHTVKKTVAMVSYGVRNYSKLHSYIIDYLIDSSLVPMLHAERGYVGKPGFEAKYLLHMLVTAHFL